MWRTWLRQSRADLRVRRLQAAVLFLMLAAGSAAIALSFTVQRSTGAVFDRVFEQANGAHIWFSSADAADFRAATARAEVAQASSPYFVLRGDLVDRGEIHPAWIWSLDGIPQVSPGLLKTGRWPQARSDGEIAVDIGLAATAGLKVGDSVRLVAGNGRLGQFRITGIVTPTFRAPYPEWTPAAVFISSTAARALADGEPSALSTQQRRQIGAGYVLGVRLEEPDDARAFASRPLGVGVMASWPDIRRNVVSEVDAPAILVRVFAIFAAIASAFVSVATITNHVSAHTRELGLLKAVGLTPRQVSMLVAGQLLALSLPAAAVGVIAGIVATPVFLWGITDLLDAPAVTSIHPPTLLIVFLAVQLLVIACAALPAWHAGRISVVMAVAIGRTPSAEARSRLAMVASRLGAPPVLVAGLKDTFSRPLRSWLTTAAIIVAAATLMMAIAFRVSLERLVDQPALIGSPPYHLEVWRSGGEQPIDEPGLARGERITREEAERVLASNQRVAAFATDVRLTARTRGVDFLSHAVGGDIERMGFVVTEGRLFRGPDELLVGLGLARDFNVGVGDRLELSLLSRHSVTMTVAGIYAAEESGGRVMMFSFDALRALEPGIDPQTYAVKLIEAADARAVLAELVEAASGRLAIRNLTFEADANTRDERQLLPPMTVLSIGFAVLASANLLSSLVFSVRERRAEFGVLKAIGFTPGQIVATVIVGVAPLALLGTLIGAPVGYYLLDVIIRSQVGDHLPADLLVLPGAGWIAALLAGATAMAFAGSIAPALRAGSTPPSETLRAE